MRAEAVCLKPREKRLGIRFDILVLWFLLPSIKLFPLNIIYTCNFGPFDQTLKKKLNLLHGQLFDLNILKICVLTAV